MNPALVLRFPFGGLIEDQPSMTFDPAPGRAGAAWFVPPEADGVAACPDCDRCGKRGCLGACLPPLPPAA